MISVETYIIGGAIGAATYMLKKLMNHLGHRLKRVEETKVDKELCNKVHESVNTKLDSVKENLTLLRTEFTRSVDEQKEAFAETREDIKELLRNAKR